MDADSNDNVKTAGSPSANMNGLIGTLIDVLVSLYTQFDVIADDTNTLDVDLPDSFMMI